MSRGAEKRLLLSRYDGPLHFKHGEEETGRLKRGKWLFTEKA